MEIILWIGIVVCVSQSAFFSGMNLAAFSVSRLRLEVEKLSGNRHAQRVINLRKDANFLLTTILWGNVAINVLLTLISNSVMAGLSAFIFSTFVITFLGEIFPQAYFSRNALRMASTLYPLLRFYQLLLYPLAKPSALMLDWMLGHEQVQFFKEQEMRSLIKKHIVSEDAEIDKVEGVGALNFLAIDDLAVAEEGEKVDPKSIIELPSGPDGLPVFPRYIYSDTDPFLMAVASSQRKWVIIVNEQQEPVYALDADRFLRDAFARKTYPTPLPYCHKPIVVRDLQKPLGKVLSMLQVGSSHGEDDVIDYDLVLIWAEDRRVITGADILGRLLRGISIRRLS
ncbi:MAG: Mg2+ and Co2+ transporter CorB [Desulfobulbaceae bacterium]|nr:MAG: Mg2+ and Co2+ transporter CorB [Desulfobulbaceae bacterium]